MRQHLYTNSTRIVGSVSMLAALAGCQPTATAYAPPEGYYPMYYPQAAATAPGYDAIEPAAGPGQAPSQAYQPIAAVSQQQLSQVDAALAKVDERLQRVEKAMLRLDRRMQLVERNELNRMTDAEPAKTSSLNNGAGQGGMGSFAAAGSEGATYSAGFQPVSSITSSLQAARPAGSDYVPVSFNTNAPVGNTSANTFGLASLADDAPTAASAPSADTELAVWTVAFQQGKVWPERAELPGSRDVVAALKSGRPVTVFARGNQPSAVAFRERVKALSQYLGRASNQESVPIAALPGSHLNDNTVEIFATY